MFARKKPLVGILWGIYIFKNVVYSIPWQGVSRKGSISIPSSPSGNSPSGNSSPSISFYEVKILAKFLENWLEFILIEISQWNFVLSTKFRALIKRLRSPHQTFIRCDKISLITKSRNSRWSSTLKYRKVSQTRPIIRTHNNLVNPLLYEKLMIFNHFLEISSIFNIHPSGSLISRVLNRLNRILELNEP